MHMREGEQAASFLVRGSILRLFSVGEVAKDLSVSPSTIRAWEDRYQLTSPPRTLGGHRRYGPADLRRLFLMRDEIAKGRRPVDAAAMAKTDTWRRDLRPRASLRRFFNAALTGRSDQVVTELYNAEKAFGLEKAISWFVSVAVRELALAFNLKMCTIEQVRFAADATRSWMERRIAAIKPYRDARLLTVTGPAARGVGDGETIAAVMRVRGWESIRMSRPTSIDSVVRTATALPTVVLVHSEIATDRSAATDLFRSLSAIGVEPLRLGGSAFASARARRQVRGEYVGEDVLGVADRLVQALDGLESPAPRVASRAC
jgi:MerR family transcriptional regulator, light-induced transcriptional regulator